MNFLAMDKIFCLGQKAFCQGQYFFVLDKIDFVWDKKYFVRADGMGISWFLTFKIDSKLQKCPIFVSLFLLSGDSWERFNHIESVSYTHLTLPTIYSV